MIKLASLALAGVLGIAGIASAQPAAACPVGVVGPGVGYGPVGYVRGPYHRYYVHDRFWHHGYDRFDRFHHRWD